MASAGPVERVEDVAARWAVASAYGDMTPENQAELKAWLEADPRHKGAYIRAKAGLYAMEDAALGTRQIDESNEGYATIAPGSLRRRVRWIASFTAGGLALAASIAAVVALRAPTPADPPMIAAAAPTLNLEDGSVATLGQDARIAFSMEDGTRKVTLLNGEARFDVAQDKTRPFVVQSGEVYAQATGTVYSVTRLGSTGGAVSVSEGSVLVWARDERDQAVLLHAGGTLTLDPGPGRPQEKPAQPLPPPDVAQISLDNDPLISAVKRFNRVNRTQIVIADPDLEKMKVVGLFKANDPEQFAESIATLSGAKIEHKGEQIVIKMK